MSCNKTVFFAVVGALASFSAQGQTILHSFDTVGDGEDATAPPLFVPGSPDNFLYGTTEFGGALNNGTVWKYDLSSNTESVVHSFGKGAGRDGSRPTTALIQHGPYLYGATIGGGGGGGTIYRIEIATGAEKVLYRFTGSAIAPEVVDKLLYNGGMLYGATYDGGTARLGTIFQCTLTGNCTTLYSFAGGSDGAYPSGGLIYQVVSVNGVNQPALFGATSQGGSANLGTVYMLPLTGATADTVLHSFGRGTDGASPGFSLVAYGPNLVGTTAHGGGTACGDNRGTGCGTVFSISPAGTNYKILYAFAGYAGPPQFDGSYPSSSLTVVGDLLYGTTGFGGTSTAGACTMGCGTVYKFTPANGSETVVANLQGEAKGQFPLGIVSDTNTLYSVTTGYYNRPVKFNAPSVLFSIP